MRLDKERGRRKECCAVLRRKKTRNPFHSLAYIYSTKARERFKHTTQQGMRAGGVKVLNVRPALHKVQ